MKKLDLRDVELFREYVLKSGSIYTINQPRTLFISESGSHKILDVYGIVHRIPAEDIGIIRWKPKNEDMPVKY